MSRKQARSAPAPVRFHTVGDIGDMLGVSDKTVRRRISEGALPIHRIGRQVRISDHDFQAYVAAQRRRVLDR